jgi:hypothetical protein
MVRCHGCGLSFRIDSGGRRVPAIAASFSLDAAVDEQIRDAFAHAGAERVLEIVHGSVGALGKDARLDVTTVELEDRPWARLSGGSFDAAFINGVLESVLDPVAFLRDVRSLLKPGGEVHVVVRSVQIAELPSDEDGLPSNIFTSATLLRLLRTAGFSTTHCGLMVKDSATGDALDSRLTEDRRFSWVLSLGEALAQGPEVTTSLLSARGVAKEPAARPLVSILMPVFNEVATFRDTFDRVYNARIDGVDREFVIVESNSTDGSREAVREVEHLPGVKVIFEEKPQGKGHAVRAAFAAASGDIFLIQDADSEYDVADYDIVLEPLLNYTTTFVLGSRHVGGRTWKIRKFEDAPVVAAVMNMAHESFTAFANWLYGIELRDPTTMYKVFRKECINDVFFRRNRFDFDWELVCKLIRRGHLPVEVPVNYRSRSFAEGKKVGFFRDPLTWLEAIVSSRFENTRHR